MTCLVNERLDKVMPYFSVLIWEASVLFTIQRSHFQSSVTRVASIQRLRRQNLSKGFQEQTRDYLPCEQVTSLKFKNPYFCFTLFIDSTFFIK